MNHSGIIIVVTQQLTLPAESYAMCTRQYLPLQCSYADKTTPLVTPTRVGLPDSRFSA